MWLCRYTLYDQNCSPGPGAHWTKSWNKPCKMFLTNLRYRNTFPSSALNGASIWRSPTDGAHFWMYDQVCKTLFEKVNWKSLSNVRQTLNTSHLNWSSTEFETTYLCFHRQSWITVDPFPPAAWLQSAVTAHCVFFNCDYFDYKLWKNTQFAIKTRPMVHVPNTLYIQARM